MPYYSVKNPNLTRILEKILDIVYTIEDLYRVQSLYSCGIGLYVVMNEILTRAYFKRAAPLVCPQSIGAEY
jgi:hypothetical protein